MLGRVLVAIAGGMVMWRYRDALRTVQEKSEVLLDQAKQQLSSRLESARERVRAGGRVEGSRGA
jgi:Tfp pilus assembly protein PilN